jgi:hypothetical protein
MQPINYCRLWIGIRELANSRQQITVEIVPLRLPTTDEQHAAQLETTKLLMSQLVEAANRMGYSVHYNNAAHDYLFPKEGGSNE